MPNTKTTTKATATTAAAVTAEACEEQVIARVLFEENGKVLGRGLLHAALGGGEVIALSGGSSVKAPDFKLLCPDPEGGLRSLGAFWGNQGACRPRKGEWANEQWLYEALRPDEGLALEIREVPDLENVWEVVAYDRPYRRVTAEQLGWTE